jgi:putative SOS response-associated peptidase YedK
MCGRYRLSATERPAEVFEADQCTQRDSPPQGLPSETHLRKRPCLIPAGGFYGCKKTGSAKQPSYIALKDDSLFPFPVCGKLGTRPTARTLNPVRPYRNA